MAAVRIGMIGPGLDVAGGMTAVYRHWLGARALRGAVIDWIPASGTGRAATRLRRMARCEAAFVRRLAGGYRPDVFHVHVADRRSFWRKAAWLRQVLWTGRPVVLHVHGADFEAFRDGSGLNRAVVGWAFEQAHTVVVGYRRFAERVVEWATGVRRVEVVEPAVPIEDFAAMARARTDGPTDRPTVLMMGRIGARKGAFDLLSAVPDVVRHVPGARFVFAGDGEVARLRDEVRAMDLQRYVDVPGWLDGAARLRAFAEADVYCLPSHAEHMPMSVAEAMAAGLPVVSTRVAGIPEQVGEGETGFLVESGDTGGIADRLIRLLRDPTLRQQFGRRGLQRAEERWDRERVVAGVRRLWDELAL